MQVLYCAIDQVVPGTLGGSTHVRAVAEGLAGLGHEVHVLVREGDGGFPRNTVKWHPVGAPLGRPHLRLFRTGAVRRAAAAIRPDVVIERYHNFGGEGAVAARAVGARYVLEVNAPVIDHPGSRKASIDRVLVIRPMRRWRNWQVERADLVVTPSAAILPPGLRAERVLQIEWGADTERFRPGVRGALPFTREPGTIVATFAGAFRAWHGAIQLVDAIRQLHLQGFDELRGVFLGDGPERQPAIEATRGDARFTFAGRVPHDQMPAALAASDLGVAPFDAGRHPPLVLGFYWSPLKVFEYMAAGLPVVAPALPRLRELVAHDVEGVLYDPPAPEALAAAIASLRNPERRASLGARARERAVRDYSWTAHCRALDQAMRRLP
jgi:glycosyltransferase involved in cell wall biosynthesis